MSSGAHTAESPRDGSPPPDTVPDALARFAESWSTLLVLGLAMIALGVTMLAWPGATVLVLAVAVAIQLFANGVYHIVTAFSRGSGGAGTRALLVAVGALSLLAGFLCLRAPLQTLLFIGLLLGSWWLVTGIIDAATALFRGDQPGRWAQLAMALFSIAAGVVVLVQPGISLFVLKLVLAVWLIGYGAASTVAALALRAHAPRAAAPTPPAAEGLAPA